MKSYNMKVAFLLVLTLLIKTALAQRNCERQVAEYHDSFKIKLFSNQNFWLGPDLEANTPNAHYHYDFYRDEDGYVRRFVDSSFLTVHLGCGKSPEYKMNVNKNDKKFYIDGKFVITSNYEALQAVKSSNGNLFVFSARFDPGNKDQWWKIVKNANHCTLLLNDNHSFNLMSLDHSDYLLSKNPMDDLVKLVKKTEIKEKFMFNTYHYKHGILRDFESKSLVYRGCGQQPKFILLAEMKPTDRRFMLSIDGLYIKTMSENYLEVVENSPGNFKLVASNFKEGSRSQMWSRLR